MDLDNKSKFVEMHQTAVLRQMLEFAKSALSLDIVINLNYDFTGNFSGAMGGSFEHIGEAANMVKEEIKKHVAKTITTYNKNLKHHIEETKRIAKERDQWRALGEDVLTGKYTVPEEVLPQFMTNAEFERQFSAPLRYMNHTAPIGHRSDLRISKSSKDQQK
jgi:hypothetical protein